MDADAELDAVTPPRRVSDGAAAECSVSVAVNVRPQVAKELDAACRPALALTQASAEVATLDGKHGFTFDHVYGEEAGGKPSADIYRDCVEGLVNGILNGYNATVLAYGQTGSGKTYTMGTGAEGCASAENGIVPLAVRDLYSKVQEAREANPDHHLHISASFVEIHVDEVRDLLSPVDADGVLLSPPVSLRETKDGQVVLSGATETDCPNIAAMQECLGAGFQARATAATCMNNSSSRSHAIFTVYLTKEALDDPTTAKIHFVDLAGSERVKRTGAEGQRLREGIHINKGLLVLGNVISALCDRDSLASSISPGKSPRAVHVPYRDSKLTRLLQDSLGGNSKTCMIACVSPADVNQEETVNTLKYAARARNIKNKPIKNLDAAISALEVAQLRSKLAAAQDRIQNLESNGSLQSGNASWEARARAAENENRILRDENRQLQRFLQDSDAVTSSEVTGDNKPGMEVSEGLLERYLKRITELEKSLSRTESALHQCRGNISPVTSPDRAGNYHSDHEDDDCDPDQDFRLDDSDDSDHEGRESDQSLKDQMDELQRAYRAKQDEMAIQERDGDSANHETQRDYERILKDLAAEKTKIEEERDEVAAALRKLERTHNERSKERERYQTRVRELEKRLRDVQTQSHKYTVLQKQLETSENKRRQIQGDCLRIKQQMVQLSRKLEREAKKSLQEKREQEKEIKALKRKEVREAARLRSITEKSQRQEAVIRRKTEEANNNKKLLKDAMAKQTVITRAHGGSAVLRARSEKDRSQWVSGEIENFLLVCELQESLDKLVSRRNEIQNEEPQLSSSKDAVELEQLIVSHKKQIGDARTAEFARWSVIRNLPESRAMLKTVFKAAAKSRYRTQVLQQRIEELECLLDEFVTSQEETHSDGNELPATEKTPAPVSSASAGQNLIVAPSPIDLTASLVNAAIVCSPAPEQDKVEQPVRVLAFTPTHGVAISSSEESDLDDENLDKTWDVRNATPFQTKRKSRKDNSVGLETEKTILDHINQRRVESGLAVTTSTRLTTAILREELKHRVEGIEKKAKSDLINEYCLIFNIARIRKRERRELTTVLAESNN